MSRTEKADLVIDAKQIGAGKEGDGEAEQGSHKAGYHTSKSAFVDLTHSNLDQVRSFVMSFKCVNKLCEPALIVPK